MLNKIILQHPNDYFTILSKRENRGVYFYRLNKYNDEIREFILKYLDIARATGVVIEGKLQNPTNENLSYYNEIMGSGFQLNQAFIYACIKRWLPRLGESQRKNISESMYSVLCKLKSSGKNENILKNVYIKFMCWLYYKFERVVQSSGGENIPKILYEGSISFHELLILQALSAAGCDILLIQCKGDNEYLKLDPTSSVSYELKLSGMTGSTSHSMIEKFPEGFSLKQLKEEEKERQSLDILYGGKPKAVNCTNAWLPLTEPSTKISSKLSSEEISMQTSSLSSLLEEVHKAPNERGSDKRFYYNCFWHIFGVDDRVTYKNDLFKFLQRLKSDDRSVVVVNKEIQQPTYEEINEVRKRSSYKDIKQLISDLTQVFFIINDLELRKVINKVFIDIVLEEYNNLGKNINKLVGRAVYIICWFKRYCSKLFDFKINNTGGYVYQQKAPCFIYMGGCSNQNEALFCRFLARLPVDVLIFTPNLNNRNRVCDYLKDKFLYKIEYPNSLDVQEYPESDADLVIATAAYHAERDLDDILYTDSGMYRNKQFSKANSVTLKTTYEEISILWDQEVKYRPNFDVVDNVVNIPVIFSKVSGVKDGDTTTYWQSIKILLTEDTILITDTPHIASASQNPIKQYVVDFYKNNRLQITKIKNHKTYQYGFLREPIQDYLLGKLQLLLDSELIKGTHKNGTEYIIISTILNLEKNIIRKIQSFDFTGKNPKVIYILPDERSNSLEDTIVLTFLNIIGFDILLFVPTGYQCIEKYLNKKVFEEHQIGEYLFDLQIPNFSYITIRRQRQTGRQSGQWRRSLRDIFLGH